MREIGHFCSIASLCSMAALLVAGCGLQGPLYLPKDAPPTQSVLVPASVKADDPSSAAANPDDEDPDSTNSKKTSPANPAP